MLRYVVLLASTSYCSSHLPVPAIALLGLLCRSEQDLGGHIRMFSFVVPHRVYDVSLEERMERVEDIAGVIGRCGDE